MSEFDPIVSYPPHSRFILGLDLGKARDYTSLVVVEQASGPNGVTYVAKALRRAPLQTPYTEIVWKVGDFLREPFLHPLHADLDYAGRTVLTDGPDPIMVIDASGVGSAVVDIFMNAGFPATMEALTITGGAGHSCDRWGMSNITHFKVSKIELVGTVQVLLQSRRLVIPSGLELAEVLRKELLDFQVKITASANETFNAREGQHDDLVLALAMAVWRGEYRALRAAPLMIGGNILGGSWRGRGR
jgi:hypothetical protein